MQYIIKFGVYHSAECYEVNISFSHEEIVV